MSYNRYARVFLCCLWCWKPIICSYIVWFRGSELLVVFLKFLYDQDPVKDLVDLSEADDDIEIDMWVTSFPICAFTYLLRIMF